MNDKEFIKNEKVPMTKEEVRYVTMGYLDITSKKNILDVGSGTGTISIEALMQNPNILVTAIENDDKAYATTLMNIESFEQRYGNIQNRIKLLKEKAPCELDVEFDAVFIGGSKGNVKEIIDWAGNLLEKNGTMVLNFITLENFYDTLKAIEENQNLADIKGCQLSVNKLENLARYKYLKPLNPVFVISCKKI